MTINNEIFISKTQQHYFSKTEFRFYLNRGIICRKHFLKNYSTLFLESRWEMETNERVQVTAPESHLQLCTNHLAFLT